MRLSKLASRMFMTNPRLARLGPRLGPLGIAFAATVTQSLAVSAQSAKEPADIQSSTHTSRSLSIQDAIWVRDAVTKDAVKKNAEQNDAATGSQNSRPQVPMVLATTGHSIATPELVGWLTKLIRDNLPPTYEDDKKWGKTKKVWNGVRLRREGFRLETESRIRTVNTGTWTRYQIKMVEPEQRVHVRFDRLEPLKDGRIRFRVSVECALDIFGRLSQWVRDVQIISLSANADATCRMTVEGTVGVKLNVFQFPPDVTIDPKVDVAQVELVDYRVRRISQVGGDLAKVLGKGLRSSIDRKLEDFNSKLVDKINKQLDKQREKLRFSSQDWLKNKLPLPKRA